MTVTQTGMTERAGDRLIIGDDVLQVGFDPRTGALTLLQSLLTGWTAQAAAGHAEAFELFVPTEDRRYTRVLGHDQELADFTAEDDGRRARLRWDRVTTEGGETLDIAIAATVQVVDGQATFSIEVTNGSPSIIESVGFPVIGALLPPVPDVGLRDLHLGYNAGWSSSIYPRFENTRGYYGTMHPTQFHTGVNTMPGSPGAPFKLIEADDDRGMYIGVHNPEPVFAAFELELLPGWSDSLNSTAPVLGDLGDGDQRIRSSVIHVPHVPPGESVRLPDIAIEFYAGGWHHGADIYRSWRDGWFSPASLPAWAEAVHSWQSIQLNSPEDTLRTSFADLVQVGREAVAAGITAIQIIGWNTGGQDQNNPSHEPDERLGGTAALKDAIVQLKAMGLKVILFVKFTWADRATSRFREDLIRFSIKDPYGDYYLHPGYQYDSPAQLLDLRPKRLVPMCFLSEEYLEICDAEFAAVLELDPDGVLFDESMHHWAWQCFDPDHGHAVGAGVFANDVEFGHRLARQAPPGFLIAGEGLWDAQFGSYHVSYTRTEDPRHIPLGRYLQPRGQIMTCVTGFDDRGMINQALLYRYLLIYEPFNFKGRITDMPATVDYGQRMDELRLELREWLWDGTFRGTDGARVTREDGEPHHPFSVFEAADGTSALVVANDSSHEVTLSMAHLAGSTSLRYREVGSVDWVELEGPLRLPALSAAIVLEGGSR